MTSLYEVLKAQKMGAAIAPDYFTALWAGATGGGEQWEVLEYTGAVPVEIYAAGEPLIEMIISGNMQQTGTPTPATPIQPQVTGEKTGQLWNYPVEQGSVRESSPIGSSFADVNNYTSDKAIRSATPVYIKDRVISCDTNTYRLYVCFFDADILYTGEHTPTWTTNPVTPPEGAYYAAVVMQRRDSADITPDEFSNMKVMLNSGSTALPYEPYGYKIPISSAGQTTPIYLGEVETTRQIRKLVLTGSEAWQRQTTSHTTCINLYCPVSDALPNSMIVSNIVVYAPVVGGANDENVNVAKINAGGTNLLIDMALSDYADITAWVTYLQQQYAAGTPVTVWYVLANETTGIVNEPLRKIGNYADTLSLPQTIPTVEGENVIDVETTLKPSEIYLKYKGRSNS